MIEKIWQYLHSITFFVMLVIVSFLLIFGIVLFAGYAMYFILQATGWYLELSYCIAIAALTIFIISYVQWYSRDLGYLDNFLTLIIIPIIFPLIITGLIEEYGPLGDAARRKEVAKAAEDAKKFKSQVVCQRCGKTGGMQRVFRIPGNSQMSFMCTHCKKVSPFITPAPPDQDCSE